MATYDNSEGPEYCYVTGGFPDTNDGYRHYQDLERRKHPNDEYRQYQDLERQKQPNRQNRAQTARSIEPVQIESTGGADNQPCSKKPPWWVWLLVVIGLVIIAGLAAVLVIFLQSSSKQNTTESLNETNCQSLLSAGYLNSGVLTISPDGVRKIPVYCEQTLDGGGWTVFQRRFNGQVDFDRPWSEYRVGFGDVAGEHWLGNANILLLTAARNQKLKIEMTHPDGTLAYADYSSFWIEKETDNYTLSVSGFTPRDPPGDSFSDHNGAAFTTRDRDNDILVDANCAKVRPGGWWFTNCHPSHLNGLYGGVDWNGILWHPWTSENQSLVTVRMMVKTTQVIG